MTFNALVVAFVPAVLALPAPDGSHPSISTRESAKAATDRLLFSDTLEEFTAFRKAKDPASLDWTSDGCSKSPDNPFGFDFEPGCNRHDFGYRNYKKQDRFTESNRLKIDDNLKADLYHQCESESPEEVCKALAEVYYRAVREFGNKRDASEFEEALAIYNELVEEAQRNGELPTTLG